MSSNYGVLCGVCLLFLILFSCTRPALGQEKGLSVGETLEYQVFMKGLPIGEQTLRIRRENTYENRRVFEIEMSLKSYAAYALFYSYAEQNLLYLDALDLTPVYLKKSVKEKEKSWVEEYFFGSELVEKRVLAPEAQTQVTTYEAEHPLLEGLSLIYYLRNRPWRQGQNQIYYLTYKGPQRVTYEHQGKQRIRVLNDYQRADIVHDPISQVTVWFSQDEAVYPLRIQATTNLGAITARLVKINPGSGE